MKLVFFHGDHDYWKYYLENTKVSFDVKLVFGRKIFSSSKLVNMLFRIHCSERINKYLHLPFKKMWLGKMMPPTLSCEKPITFIIYTSYIASIPFSAKPFIDYLRQHYNCKIAIMFGNTVESENQFFNADAICPLADLVCSYNTEDIGKYNLKVHPTLYFNVNTPQIPLSQRKIDVFFIGQEKGRGEEINALYSTLTKFGLYCEFYIVGLVESERIEGIHYVNSMIPYSFVVEKIANTKCLLNLLWKGSKGITIRDIEAFNNGCYILKNYVDESLYEVLHKEQILLTSEIDAGMAQLISSTKDIFPKKKEVPSLDSFYQWLIDECWNNEE